MRNRSLGSRQTRLRRGIGLGGNHDRIKWQPSSGLGGNHGPDYATDDQDRIIREFLERGQAPSPEVRIPEGWIRDKDKMAAIRDRLARAEQRFKGKDGEGLRMDTLIGKLDDTHAKVLKDDHKDIQDLILLLASRAGIL